MASIPIIITAILGFFWSRPQGNPYFGEIPNLEKK